MFSILHHSIWKVNIIPKNCENSAVYMYLHIWAGGGGGAYKNVKMPPPSCKPPPMSFSHSLAKPPRAAYKSEYGIINLKIELNIYETQFQRSVWMRSRRWRVVKTYTSNKSSPETENAHYKNILFESIEQLILLALTVAFALHDDSCWKGVLEQFEVGTIWAT